MTSLVSKDEAGPRFRFRRYRQEVARRSREGMDDDPGDEIDEPDQIEEDTDCEEKRDNFGGAVLEDLTDVNILIQENGRVVIRSLGNHTEGSICTEEHEGQQAVNHHPSVIPEGTTLLLRNLRDCMVHIRLPLPAVHFVHIYSTNIHYFNHHRDNNNNNSNSTIHMTSCRDGSSLTLERSVQQMRIHESKDLRVVTSTIDTVQKNRNFLDQWNPGSIILESTQDLVVVVPPLKYTGPSSMGTESLTTQSYWYQVVVKDFQWLRKGIPSPNVRIEVIQPKPAVEPFIKRDVTEDDVGKVEEDDSDDEL